MTKTIQVVLFSKSAIPNNDKFINKFIDELDLNKHSKIDLTQYIDQGNGNKILVSKGGPGGLDIEISDVSRELTLSIFGINVQLTFNEGKIDTILDKIEKSFKILDDAYLEINRIGFVSTIFDESINNISDTLKMPYLSKQNEVDFRINEQIMIEDLECNKNIFISNRRNEKGIIEKGLLNVLDLNTRINLEKIFNSFSANYYRKDLSEILK